ncbi:MAG: ATP-binding protein [Megasphaera sp.]|jgi:signal transduction histidine kinase|nr:ATP-binding protein [Megasphaera sp.]MCH4187130.1 ATP-binding protein [Megasphaera sp.]MCH4216934.1 ATP-binding protein [Megasphaera sp.]
MIKKQWKQKWQRRLSFAPLPLFAKMVLLYSSIVFCILLIVSVITVTSVHYIIASSIKNDLYASAQSTMEYLDRHGKIDSSIFIRSNLQPFVNLQVYDGAGKFLLDNGPTHAVKKLSDRYIDDDIQNASIHPLPTTIEGNETSVLSYYKKWSGTDGKSYYLRFSRIPDKENDFVSLLSKQLVASILISLILTILSGMYLMKKSLDPLHKINETLKGIEVNKLGDRITLSDDKNEIHDLAVTINQALDRIEYGYKQQQQFISNASHELRTPITVITGYVNLLDRWGKNDPAALQESITAIKSETEYMRQLIERLLFFARSNSGTLKEHFTDINTAVLMQELYNEISLIDTRHTILLKRNDKATIYAEPGSVKQMLRIFVDNALKYTPTGGKIYLSCEQRGDKICYKITDTGIGIPDKEQKLVFERFYRVESSRSKDTGGSGLGLSIAKYIAKGNNAELHLESKVNKGTTMMAIFAIKRSDKS